MNSRAVKATPERVAAMLKFEREHLARLEAEAEKSRAQIAALEATELRLKEGSS